MVAFAVCLMGLFLIIYKISWKELQVRILESFHMEEISGGPNQLSSQWKVDSELDQIAQGSV